MSDINSISPDFRDFLLGRNLVTDTVKENGLFGKLEGIGKASNIETPPNSVKASADIEDIGLFYRDTVLMTNEYRGEDEEVSTAEIIYQPIDDFRFKGTYDKSDSTLIQDSEDKLNDNVLKNRYQDEQGRYLINLISNPIGQEGEPYLDSNGEFTVGGPSTTALDIAGSILTGRGVGFSVDGPEPNYDVRGSLAGRVLSSVGLINDSPLGNIGAQQLTAHLGYNLAFNLQEETLGRVNTNVISILKGNNIIVPNYQITVAKNTLVKILDYGAKVLGFEVPVSLLERDSSIFATENPVANVLRAGQMVLNTGKGQVLALIQNLNENKYRYKITDDRTKKGANKIEIGTNPKLYAYGDNEGGILDLLNGGEKFEAHISKSNYEKDNDNSAAGKGFLGEVLLSQNGLELLADNEGGENSRDLAENIGLFPSNDVGFSWAGAPDGKEDSTDNKIGRLTQSGYDTIFDANPNSILYKTKKLFDSGKMRTLVSGKGVKIGVGPLQKGDIGNTNGVGFMSKGSAVLSESQLDPKYNAETPAEIFCRTWTNFDRYNQVANLQKNRGLDRLGTSNSNLSVLDDNGFVKIAPYKSDFDKKGDYNGDTPKKYMFSIENLAWEGYTTSLPECEKGPGDLLTGAKGRIMWFPPYEMGFTDNSTVNWESNNFIGRGEPLYTYNNTERKGTLQWKIIIDHNTYQNAMVREGASDDEIISFNAGCLDATDKVLKSLTKDELVQAEVQAQQEPIKMVEAEEPEIPEPAKFYFPNDSASIPIDYEDGIEDPDGETQGDGFVAKYRTKALCGQPYKGFYKDNTDFGLNDQSWVANGDEYVGVSYIQLAMGVILTNTCKSCKVNITGSVSQQVDEFKSNCGNLTLQEQKAENQENQEILATARANTIKQAITTQLVANGEVDPDGRFNDIKINVDANQVTTQEGQEARDYKSQRFVTVEFIYDRDLAIANGEVKEPVKETPKKKNLKEEIRGRMVTECDYFEKLEQTDKFTYESIKKKMTHFHPAFHSITPEGFNSRLTFLKQCTRQGPTKNPNGNPGNLAFGRPPICILRIGDFYNTKIAIDNVSFSFEPLVWDLNPEGIGVQPMICNVDMTFSFIGGSSLAGPINRLQNALGFNYFANTELYDDRADKIKINSDPNKKSEIVLGALDRVELTKKELEGDDGDATTNGGTEEGNNQDVDAANEVEGTEEVDETLSEEDQADIDMLKNAYFFAGNDSDDDIRLTIKDILALSEGWGYKLYVEKLDETTTYEELTSKSPLDPLVDINDDGKLIIEKAITYGGIGPYWIETESFYGFQESLEKHYDSIFYDVEDIIKCFEGRVGNVLERKIGFKIEFFKEGVETIYRYTDCLLYKQTEYSGQISGQTEYFYGGYNDQDVKKAEALGFTEIEIDNDAKKDTIAPNDYMAMTNYINTYTDIFCRDDDTVAEEIFEDPNQDNTPVTDDEEAPI